MDRRPDQVKDDVKQSELTFNNAGAAKQPDKIFVVIRTERHDEALTELQ